MLKRIIIARHGNTFKDGETPKRVGAKTDIPLVETHRALSIGKYLKENNIFPDKVYSSPLIRAVKTAEYALQAMEINMSVIKIKDFTEIDYGPDENKTEEEVMLRLGNGDISKGKSIIEDWNNKAIVPEDWNVDPHKIIDSWINFANNIITNDNSADNILLVSSNGIIRFAPYLTGDFDNFIKTHDIKVATGAICIFERNYDDIFWKCTLWNYKPYKNYSN